MGVFGPSGCGAVVLKVAKSQGERHGLFINGGGVRIGLSKIEVDAINFTTAEGSVFMGRPQIVFSIWGLLRKRIDTISIEYVKLEITPEEKSGAVPWQEINPAEMVAEAFVKRKGWMVRKVDIDSFKVATLSSQTESGSRSANLMADGSLKVRSGEQWGKVSVDFGGGVYGLPQDNAVLSRGSAVVNLYGDGNGGGRGDLVLEVESLSALSKGKPLGGVLFDVRRLSVRSTMVATNNGWRVSGTLFGNSAMTAKGDGESSVAAELGVEGSFSANGRELRGSDYHGECKLTGGGWGGTEKGGWRVPQLIVRLRGGGREGSLPELRGEVDVPTVKVTAGGMVSEVVVGGDVCGVWPFESVGGSVTSHVANLSNQGIPLPLPLAAEGTWRVVRDVEGVSGSVSGVVVRADADFGAAVARGVSATAVAEFDKRNSVTEPAWRLVGLGGVEQVATTNGVLKLEELELALTVAGKGGVVEEVAVPELGWRELSVQGSLWEPGLVSGVVSGGVARVGFDLGIKGGGLRAEVVGELPLDGSGVPLVRLTLPEQPLDLGDNLERMVPIKLPMTIETGSVKGEATVTMGSGGAVTEGSGRIRNVQLSGEDGLWSISGVGVSGSFTADAKGRWQASGRASVQHMGYDRVVATNGWAQWHAKPDELFVERAQAWWCGGQVQMFALRANARQQSGNLTLFIDQVELEEILGIMRAVPGRGEGKLHGRLQVRYRDNEVRLGRGYLYSLPGEGGRVQINDTAMVEAALQGVDAAVRKQVVAALGDMAYTVFRLDLEPPKDRGGEADLKLRLSGEADKRRDLPPVNLDVNLHGPLNALFNMGLKMGR
ncbi:MAG: hypothetical protein GX230_02995 [Lentisphaerae bacterium]|nr:hypothetical protein [Lentisphaerota bacterium]